MTRIELPYLNVYKDRHGRQRVYYRRGKFNMVIKGELGSIEFLENYQRIHAGYSDQPRRAAVGTFRHLVEEFYGSPRFSQLAERSKGEYRRHLDALCERIGKLPAAAIEEAHVLKWQAVQAGKISVRTGKPAIQTANDALILLKQVFDYGVRLKLITANPAKLIDPIKVKTDGWAAWPDESLSRWAKESRGTPRLAFYLGLYTAQRRSDVLVMRWDDIKGGAIYVRQHKTGVRLAIPLHPTLIAELARTPRNGMTIIHKRTGQAITDSGFGSLWSKEQKRLGIHLPFHGLRKSATNALFEAGCTPQEVQTITGQKTLAMVQLYGKDANQKRMAKTAMEKWTKDKP